MQKSSTRLFRILFAALLMGILLALGSHTALAETLLFATGWEDGQERGFVNQVAYAYQTAGYFNSSDPPPESGARPYETVRSGSYSLLLDGYSRAAYAYCYYRIFDRKIAIGSATRIGYWIYHQEGTAKIAVDGHFTDGSTIRDFGGGVLTDQHGVRIHPAARQDPMHQWYYVEVDLSAAADKTLDYIMFAFDNGGDGFTGSYRTYVDDLRIFQPTDDGVCMEEVSADRWQGEYFNNMFLNGDPVMVRDDGADFLNFDWGGGSPGSGCGIGVDRFSVRWHRRVHFSVGFYRFTVTADDGVRLYVDGVLLLDKWIDQPPTAYTAEVSLSAGEHEIRLDYYENGGGATISLGWQQDSRLTCEEGMYLAEYFANTGLSGAAVLTRCEPEIRNAWGGGGPADGLPSDNFSARWDGEFFFTTGVYTFVAQADDGVRVWVDGDLIIDAWRDQGPTEYRADRSLSVGEHNVVVEYYEHGGGATANFWWEQAAASAVKVYEAESQLYHIIGRRDGDGWAANTRDDNRGHLSYGPYAADWGAGRIEAAFRLMLDNTTSNNDEVVILDIYDATSSQVLASRTVRRREFDQAFRYQDMTLSADLAGRGGHTMEARVYWLDKSYVKFDKLQVFISDSSAPTDNSDDLTVGYIQRLPEMDYVWDSADPTRDGWPLPGEAVSWRAKVLNFSNTARNNVTYWWYLDGEIVAGGTVNIAARSAAYVNCSWNWAFERHELRLVLDPQNQIPEFEEGNNTLRVDTDAITVGFYVEQRVYDYFRQHQHSLRVHANCWEDWVQRQVRRWNQMFAEAVYPETPGGVLDRIRVDKITVVADGALPLVGGLAGNHPNLNDRTVDLQWGFPAALLDGTFYADHSGVVDANPFYYEGSLIHELGHARYLIDAYGFNVAHNDLNIVDITENGRPVAGSSYMPFIRWDVVYYLPYIGLMNADYRYIDRYSASALNLIRGHRATRGNYNAPGNIGVYLSRDLPAENRLTVKDASGQILRHAGVQIYRAEQVLGAWYGKYYDDVPDLEFTTDGNGQVLLGRCPFDDDGSIEHTYGLSNGVLILRVEYNGMTGYTFLSAADFNLEYWRGHTELGEHEVQVHLIR